MLYDCFRISVMIASAIGIIHMIAMESFIYIYFPLASLFWGVYSFFDANDKEYIRRNGDLYEQDYYGGTTYSSHSSYRRNTSYNRTAYDNTRYNGYSTYKSKQYEGISKKCARNFKISVANDGEL